MRNSKELANLTLLHGEKKKCEAHLGCMAHSYKLSYLPASMSRIITNRALVILLLLPFRLICAAEKLRENSRRDCVISGTIIYLMWVILVVGERNWISKEYFPKHSGETWSVLLKDQTLKLKLPSPPNLPAKRSGGQTFSL